MTAPAPPGSETSRILDAALRLGALLLLVVWCFALVRPFVSLIAWAAILAVAVHPTHERLRAALGGRTVLSATLFALAGLALVIVPAVMMGETVVAFTRGLAAQAEAGTLAVPPPPAGLADWPLVGAQLYEFWRLASESLEAALRRLEPQIAASLHWLLATAVGTGASLLTLLVSIVLAAGLLARSEAAARLAFAFGRRLAGERGTGLIEMAAATVRSVARGVLGIALIQSLLAGIGLAVAGVPGAGLWALLCLLLCVIQLGPGLVLFPVAIYLFSTAATVTAIAFLVWSIFVTLLDNVLKPLLLGRGLSVPLLVVFVGSIGGLLTSGILGLFVGPIVLSLGYRLLMDWLELEPQPE